MAYSVRDDTPIFIYFVRLFFCLASTFSLVACSTLDQANSTHSPEEVLPALSSTSQDIYNTVKKNPQEEQPISNEGFPLQDSNPSTSLVLWHGFDETSTLILDELIHNFRPLNPGIQIMSIYVPYDDLRDRYVKAVNAGMGPSILLGPGEWGGSFYNQGVIKDLAQHIDSEISKNVNPPAWEAVTYQGAVVGLPYSLRGVVMYRNKDIISEAPENYEDLLVLTQAATKGQTLGAYLERGGLYAYPQLTACDGMLLFPNGYPAFNNPSGLCWLKLLKSFEDMGPVSFNSKDDKDRFLAGNVGLIFEGTWNLGLFTDTLGERLAIDPWPKIYDSHLAGYVWTENIYINPLLSGEEMKAALLFGDYFLSYETQSMLEQFGKVPAVMYRDVEDKLILQAVAALSKGTPYPLAPEMQVYLDHMNDALVAVLEDGMDPEVVLHHVEEKIIKDIADFSDLEEDL
jgi:arabinogalactan oligomer/maltooligosaccharide transport system substrate-binding protein